MGPPHIPTPQSSLLFVWDVESRQGRKGAMLPQECWWVSLLPVQIILPWLTLSDKVYEKTRALGTISRLLRFACNFPELSVSAWGKKGTRLTWHLLLCTRGWAWGLCWGSWRVGDWSTCPFFCSCRTRGLTCLFGLPWAQWTPISQIPLSLVGIPA
jgi:hypothetical protein